MPVPDPIALLDALATAWVRAWAAWLAALQRASGG